MSLKKSVRPDATVSFITPCEVKRIANVKNGSQDLAFLCSAALIFKCKNMFYINGPLGGGGTLKRFRRNPEHSINHKTTCQKHLANVQQHPGKYQQYSVNFFHGQTKLKYNFVFLKKFLLLVIVIVQTAIRIFYFLFFFEYSSLSSIIPHHE